MNRSGEKWGWIGGWLGAFLWVLVMAIVWLFQGAWGYGLAGLAAFGLSVAVVAYFAPWKHPRVRYWKLLFPLYLMIVLCVALVLFRYRDSWAETSIRPWSLTPILLVFLPLLTISKKTWED